MSDKNFLGIPISGELVFNTRQVAQRPLSELEPLIRAVLDDELIHSFGWTQYTPYFNDGDPCIFGIREPWFLTVKDVGEDFDIEDFDEYDYEISGHPTLGEVEYSWSVVNGKNVRVIKSYEGEHRESWDRCNALDEAIDSDAFDQVLLEAFGDHASVTISRSGIQVEFYSHD